MSETTRAAGMALDTAHAPSEGLSENLALANRAALFLVALPAFCVTLLVLAGHGWSDWVLETGEAAILSTGGIPLVFSAGAALWWCVAFTLWLAERRRAA